MVSSEELQGLMSRHNVQNVDVARITGASETAVRAWLSGKKHVPPSVERLLLIVLGEARPEDYR